MKDIVLTASIPETSAQQRLDVVLAQLFPDYSRAKLQSWVKAGHVRLDGECTQNNKQRVKGGESVCIETTLSAEVSWVAQDLPLDIVFEDEDVLVLNKAAGVVVHPAAGNPDGTLVNALLNYHTPLEHLPRAGLIHRLDKDTTGLLIVAKTLTAHTALARAIEHHEITREYYALVNAVMTAGGTINAPIARHPKRRTHMAVVTNGKPAITHYRVAERFTAQTLLRVHLETGRTHQIRVHLQHKKMPIVGDQSYGGRAHFPPQASEALRTQLSQFKRQALHARKICFTHPSSQIPLEFERDLPPDYQALLDALRQG